MKPRRRTNVQEKGEMMDEGGGGGGDVDGEKKEEEYKTRRGKQVNAGDRGRAGMVGGFPRKRGAVPRAPVTLQSGI